MALNNVLVALTCVVTFPVAALAQSPSWTMAANEGCCATSMDDGNGLAASVLLPPSLTPPSDERATALAVAVLLPSGCCDPVGADRGDHAGMAAEGCCTDMKDGCAMPCCQSAKPTR
jgi:hypothetical protein